MAHGSDSQLDGIAIIGLAGRFPGARNADEFWQNLAAGRDCITRISDEQLAASGYDPARMREIPGYVPARGLVDRPEWFDRAFFNIGAREAEVMDPQHRVFLEVAWEALEDAGCDPSAYSGLIGVFAGMSNNTYFPYFVRPRADLMESVGSVNAVIANEKDFLTTRLAFKLNLRGPALNIQTACSSSLVSVCVACENLLARGCDIALAGGVSLTFPQERGYFYQEGSMTSPDGCCRPFDARASGTVFSSGAGVVALKRLSDALADGDSIYAVIKGHAINNDGVRKVSFAAPSANGQSDLIARAQANAGISPETIGYIEAHGTATALGDPIEVAGLSQVFRAATNARQFCALGSVKGNIGHCDAASGITGLIKTALSFHHELIPRTINCEQVNPALGLKESPFFLNTELRPWKRDPSGSSPRRAGVSSFGVGGTNAHVVLEEAPAPAAIGKSEQPVSILVLSAKTAGALERRATDLADHLEKSTAHSLADIAWTLQTGRQTFAHRRAIVARDGAEAAAALRAPAKLTRREERLDAPTVLLFPGQGSQYPGMGAGLHASEPAFRDALDECSEILRSQLNLDLREILFANTPDARALLAQTRYTQPAIFAMDYALGRLWLARGVKPAALLGHSIGEWAAAALAGVFSLPDAARLVATRASLVQALPGGAMLAARLSEAEARQHISGDAALEIAALNSPSLCVIAGPFDAIAALEERFAAEHVVARKLSTSHAFHSAMMDPVVDALEKAVASVALHEPTLPILSSVTGDWLKPEEAASPRYWAVHLRVTVRFADALARLCSLHDGALIESGPGRTLSQLAFQCPAKTPRHEIVHTIAEGGDEVTSASEAVARLWLAGVPLDWAAVNGGQRRRRVQGLPAYPFERQRYFADLPPGAPAPLATAATDGEAPWESAGTAAAPAPVAAPRAKAAAAEPVTPAPSADSGENTALVTLRRTLGDIAGLDLSDASGSTRLLELGFDSLSLSQLALTMGRKFGVKLSLGQLIRDLDTLDALAAHLAANGAVQAAPVKPAAPEPPKAQPPTKHGPFRPVRVDQETKLSARQQRWLDDFINRYVARTAASKAYTQANRRHFADPRAVAGFARQWKEMVYPIVVERSSGATLWDLDGNEWTDATVSFGAAMLGHQPDFVVEAIDAQMARGLEIGPTSPLAGEVAALLCELTGAERATFCNTGSEAVVGALRLARTVTGRPRIAYFAESYHGIDNEVLGRPAAPGDTAAIPIAPGIQPEAMANALILSYNDPGSLEIIAREAKDLAAILVEPVQSRHPGRQPGEFLKQLRDVATRHGIALIFDEVITGFRCHLGGAQAHFGVRADIATYGKVIGGGLPIGAIAGRAEFMDALDGGNWTFGDDSFPETAMTFFAGTFVRHPLAMAVARAVLLHLKEAGPALQEQLAGRTGGMVGEMNLALAGTPFSAENFGSNWLLRADPEFHFTPLLFAALRHRGIHIWQGRPCFLSTAHNDAAIRQIVDAVRDSAAELEEAGFFTRAASTPANVIPLTPAQREVWLLCQQAPAASSAANETWTLQLDGDFDAAAMRQAVQTIVNRHEALRCTFDRSGETLSIAPSLTLDIPMADLSGLPEREREAQFLEMRVSEGERAFNLETGPLISVRLVRLGASKHALLFNAHHVACDGWSCGVFLQELAAIYSSIRDGKAPELSTPMRLREYQQWVETLRQSSEYEQELKFWVDQYRVPPLPLELPGDRPLPARRSYRGGSEEMIVPGEVAAGLSQLGAQHGATLFTVLLAAYRTLLFRLTGRPDFTVGVPSAGQNDVPGGDRLMAHCVNMLPLRYRLDPAKSFSQLLPDLQNSVLGAFEHRRVTFGELLQEVSLPRVPGRVPLVPVTFNLDPPIGHVHFSGLTHRLESNPRQACQFDFSVSCDTTSEGLRTICRYNADIFEPATVRRWLADFQTILQEAAARPSRPISELAPLPPAAGSHAITSTNGHAPLHAAANGNGALPQPVMRPDQRKRILRDWNNTAAPYPADRTVHSLFREQARLTPEAIAVEDGDEWLTYAQLDRQSDAIAAMLVENGVRPADAVGLTLRRSPRLIAGMLGILKAGAAYVPLDATYPAKRIDAMLRESGARLLLGEGEAPTLETEVKWLPIGSAAPGSPPPDAGAAGDVAYIMFTSGSTGVPKGVRVRHRGISRLVINTNYVRFTAADVVAQASNTSFDAATFEIWGALLHGARLVIVPRETLLSPHELVALLRERKVSILFLTTQLFHHLAAEAPDSFGALRYLVAGGDAMQPEAARAVLNTARPMHLVNGYGPTEVTTFAVCHEVTEVPPGASSIPIGRPISNTRAYILDAALQPVPPGVEGELYLGGPGVADGYVNNPEGTAASFLPDFFSDDPEDRLYKTGDLARWREDGVIEFLGRADKQVKIRGFRIEPGEVEAVLMQHPRVRQAVVAPRVDPTGRKQLAAYISPHDGPAPTSGELRDHVLASLPEYMAPTVFSFLETLPLNANDKLDRAALAEMPVSESPRIQEAPETWTEASLVEIWESILDRRPIGVTEDFFELGGHSMLAIRMLGEVERRTGVRISPQSFFEDPKIKGVAARVSEQKASQSRSPVVKLQSEGSKPPLFFFHGDFFFGGMYLENLSSYLPKDRPCYAIEPNGFDGEDALKTIEEMAESRLKAIQEIQPEGPYFLGGLCNGGLVAFQVAQMLRAQGKEVPCLVLLGAYGTNVQFRSLAKLASAVTRMRRLDPAAARDLFLKWRGQLLFGRLLVRHHMNELRDGSGRVRPSVALAKAGRFSRWLLRRVGIRVAAPASVAASEPVNRTIEDLDRSIWNFYANAVGMFVPERYDGKVYLFRESELPPELSWIGSDLGWGKVVKNLTVRNLAGDHAALKKEANLAIFAQQLKVCMDECEPQPSGPACNGKEHQALPV